MPEEIPGIPSMALKIRTKYRGMEYGVQIPLRQEFMESDFDQYMDYSLRHAKETLRKAMKGESLG